MGERIPNVAEKARLDALRLECLKLAHSRDDGQTLGVAGEMVAPDCIAVAREMFDYVTDAPVRPELFAVKRMTGAEPGEYPTLGPLEYLVFEYGTMRWGHECSAYRFRSKAEAEAAIAKYEMQLGGAMQPVPLPPYMDLF